MLLPFLLIGIFGTGAVLSGEGRRDNKDVFVFSRGDPNEEARATANTTSLEEIFGKARSPSPSQGASRGRH